MATLQEIYDLRNDSNLKNKIAAACFIACETIRTEAATVTNHAERIKFASQLFQNPEDIARRVMYAVLAQNASATAAQISGASDATIQTAVTNAVNLVALGL